MNRFDFTPYRRTMVGFDRLFDLLENQEPDEQRRQLPPLQHRAPRRGCLSHHAGRRRLQAADIDITAQQNLLVVQGRKGDDAAGQILHVGIAQRGFERRFELADYVRVDDANLEDGLLVIDLVREVPEAMKPKKIPVGTQKLPDTKFTRAPR
jgi:molecular chaperone IbpA